jgi:alpha-glucosidase
MRWDDRPGAGFTTGTPWLPIGDRAVNVAAQREDPGSTLTLHRRLLALRRDSPALAAGAYEPVQADGDVLAYLRTGGDGRWLVALNLGPGAGRLDLAVRGRVELATTWLATRAWWSGWTDRGRVQVLDGALWPLRHPDRRQPTGPLPIRE